MTEDEAVAVVRRKYPTAACLRERGQSSRYGDRKCFYVGLGTYARGQRLTGLHGTPGAAWKAAALAVQGRAA